MDFNEIASVSGKGGLFKVVKPTRTGAILESLNDDKKRMVVGMQSKISVLSDISIYTLDGDGAIPLEEVLRKIHSEFKGDIGLTGSSDADELKSFLKFILPNYDEKRVYVSDIKKVVNWYGLLFALDPKILEPKEDKSADKEKDKPSNSKKKEDNSGKKD